MTSWVHRVTHPTTALQHIGDMILNLLIAAMIIAIGVLLFTF